MKTFEIKLHVAKWHIYYSTDEVHVEYPRGWADTAPTALVLQYLYTSRHLTESSAAVPGSSEAH